MPSLLVTKFVPLAMSPLVVLTLFAIRPFENDPIVPFEVVGVDTTDWLAMVVMVVVVDGLLVVNGRIVTFD